MDAGKGDALNPRQKRFVEEYLRSGNATQAAAAAGYSAKNAASQGSRLLADPKVQAYRRQLEQALFDQLGISQAWIGRRLVEVIERCMQAEPHLSWDREKREYVEDGTWVFDASAAIKALAELNRELDAVQEPEANAAETIEDWLSRQGGSGL